MGRRSPWSRRRLAGRAGDLGLVIITSGRSQRHPTPYRILDLRRNICEGCGHGKDRCRFPRPPRIRRRHLVPAMTSERAVPGTDVLTAGTFAAMLAPEEWSRLAELGHSVRFPAGAVLMAERSESDLVMILLEGHVKATIIGDGGREALLSLRDPGDVLGELSAIDGQPRIATVTALDRIRALAVPAPVFRRHLELTPRVAVALLVVVTHRVREATLLRSQFGGSDTMARLAARLVELAERYGRRTDNGVLITLALSQEELGAWTGASRAALANALRTLRELGWIATDRRRVLVLDLPSLRDRAA